ncbi:hypothetical protein Ciccas_009487, partial [Cichlidogyrus casuarinus]
MGNTVQCCKYELPAQNHLYQTLDDSHEIIVKEPPNFLSFNNPAFELEAYTNPKHYVKNLYPEVQHIIDRDYDDNPLENSLFSFNSLFAIQKALVLSSIDKCPILKSWLRRNPERRRHNSCSSFSIQHGTLFKPDRNVILRCTALALSLLISPISNSKEFYEEYYAFFDERIKPINPLPMLAKTDVGLKFISQGFLASLSREAKSKSASIPDYLFHIGTSYNDVHDFLQKLFHYVKIGPQCAVLSLMLFERILSNNDNMKVFSWTWRRQLLACIIIASK